MSLIKTLGVAIALAISSVTVAAPVATAQNVITIDEARILRESKVGKHIQGELKKIETQIQNELKPTSTSLENEGKTIQAKVNGKTREAVAADAALVTQLQNYQKKAGEFAQKRNVVGQEFALTERKALADFNKALQPILETVIAEKKPQAVLSKSQVVYSSPDVDVTSLIISKLDAKTPTISVTRQRLPSK